MHPLAVALKLVLITVAQAGVPSDAPLEATPIPALQPAQGGFVENRGQWPEEVRFFARGAAAEVTLLDDALVFRGVEGDLILRLPQPARALHGQHPRVATTAFFRGSASATGVRTFESVRYESIAPGVDLLVRPDGASFAYDLMLAPCADLDALVLRVEGAAAMDLTADGRLLLLLSGGPVEQRIGACWQVDPKNGALEPIHVRYRQAPNGDPVAFGFEAPGRQDSWPLVIDPTLHYCTYLGSADFDEPLGIAADAEGYVYVLGRATSAMPITAGAFQSEMVGNTTVWVGKLSANGTALEWATFLDGNDSDLPAALAVDDHGVIVVGRTWSADFPVTSGGYQTAYNDTQGRSDAFVVRLDPSTGHMDHGTFFGGELGETPSALALSPDGDVVIAINPVPAQPSELQATAGAFDTNFNPPDKLIVRFSADLSEVVFATWFPIARVNALATDADGNVYFTGDSSTATGPVPVTPGAFQTVPGDTKDGVVGKLDPTGSELIWCTYLGGGKADTTWGMAVDEARAVYVVGSTAWTVSDFPTTPGAFSNVPVPSGSASFATKILPDGSGLVWSTYIGGLGAGHLQTCAVDAAGSLVGVGSQNSSGWPTTPDALQTSFGGPGAVGDLVLTKFDATGSTLVYSTFFGGNSTDYQPHAAIDSDGRVHVAFYTLSSDLPVTAGAYQPNHLGNAEIGLAAFDLPMLPWRLSDSASKVAPYIPNLVGLGGLEPGSPTRLSVRGGKPFGLAWLVLGVAEWSLPLPLYGSVLYPSPDFLLPFQLGPSGELELTFPAPAGPGDLHFQLIGFEPTAPGMLYASNGLRTAKP